MTPQQFLATHWVFTRTELARVLARRGRRSDRTISSHLARWQKLGKVRRVRAGLYVRDTGKAAIPDLLPLAAKAAPDAALSYHTALEAHGYAQSLFERLTFVTWTKAKPFHFEGRQFSPVRPRAALARAGLKHGWIDELDRSGVEVRVTSLERTVVDVFDRPELAGGVEEVWRSCAAVPALDLKELERYLLLLGRGVLVAKLGYFLEERSEELLVPNRLIAELRRRRPRSPAYVSRKLGGRLAKDWNLVVPHIWDSMPARGETT